MEKSDDRGEAFHAHLDMCEQCRDHPFNLCHAGRSLLVAAVDGKAEQPNAEASPAPPLDEEGFPF